MAIVRVQAPTPVAATTATTISVTWGSTTTAGNLLIAVLQTRGNSSSITAPTGMTAVCAQTLGTTERQYLYAEENCSARSGAQTFSWSTATDATMHLVEYSGILVPDAFDTNAENSGSSTTPDSGTTATTAQAVELWFAMICNRNVETQSTPTNGFTQVNRVHSANGTAAFQLEGAIYEAIVSGTGAANTSVTLSGSARNWGGCVCTFKGTTGSPDVALTTIDGTASVPTPSISTSGDTSAAPDVVEAVVSMDAPTTAAAAALTLETVSASVSMDAPEVFPPTAESLIVDHSSPAGFIRDPRQKHFLYHRPPFVLPSNDP